MSWLCHGLAGMLAVNLGPSIWIYSIMVDYPVCTYITAESEIIVVMSQSSARSSDW